MGGEAVGAMELPVVVGVDGSEGNPQAVDWAVAAAERAGLPLRLVHASLWEHYEGVRPRLGGDRPLEQVCAENLVSTAEDRAHRLAAGVRVSTEVWPEDPVTALLREGHEASLLVLGPRGHGPIVGLLLGSASLAVAARAHCPVVVARGAEPNRRATYRRVVVGVGDSAGSAAAARFAFREARSRGCELVAVRAWHRTAHLSKPSASAGADPAGDGRQRADAWVDQVLGAVREEYPEVALRRKVVRGTAHRTLLDEAATADLLVVGARRRGAVGLQLGRVNHAVLRRASCPVAIVPEQG
ncbi:universal stress protein [Streptomyces sp. NPDC058200]|uniref:universal stress protein n=1 Tax=Streptomyces sp. NPDC058200 TaxID=3346378 RepID=UPI0036E304B3